MNENMKFYYTVGDLIEKLKNFSPELPVLVSGYETGYENFFTPRIAPMIYLPENLYWDGEFQQAEKGDRGTFEAVVLDRVMRHD